MSTATATLEMPRLSRQKLAAVRRKARHLGITTQQYIQQLIENDLALDKLAQSKSFGELSAPFEEAFKQVSEAEIGEFVEQARRRHHPRLSKR